MADQLTRILSLALRHKPDVFGIAVDSQGWADLPSLVAGIQANFPAVPVTEESVREFVAAQLVERFEIQATRVRALYGHSLQHVTVGEQATPAGILYHATRAVLLPRIRATGLEARGRNGVHFTAKWEYALSVSETHTRKGQRGVILAVKTEDTLQKGVVFYRATEHIWLSPYVPARFLSMVPLPAGSSRALPPGTLVPLDNSQNRAILRRGIDELFSE
jgi:putative RNA 2'-phosphotransferase